MDYDHYPQLTVKWKEYKRGDGCMVDKEDDFEDWMRDNLNTHLEKSVGMLAKLVSLLVAKAVQRGDLSISYVAAIVDAKGEDFEVES